MSTFLEDFSSHARQNPAVLAFSNSQGDQLTYEELAAYSDALACYLNEANPEASPVVVFGHKEPAMLSGMLACMKAGCAYVPIDAGTPAARIDAMVSQLNKPLVLCASEPTNKEGFACAGKLILPDELHTICTRKPTEHALEQLHPISGDDPIYVLFTSGSTGTPKGVVQRAQSLDLTARYFAQVAPSGEHLTFFNRAPFSFDLSIFDLAMALPQGHAMFALDAQTETSMRSIFEALHDANIDVFISTPSFLTMCLTDPSFSPELLPNVKSFIMCGETLYNTTARTCLERFPHAELVNMYGPSETCGAVTDVAITPKMAAASEPLPVGRVSPYSELAIVDPDTLDEVPCRQSGEIFILGDTAAAGYLGLEDKTKACFFDRTDHAGNPQRCYRTGDEGWVDEDGLLHYGGRFDLQLKIGGYRIELGDIEENLSALPSVATCCVVPVRKGAAESLAAHVVPAQGVVGDRVLTKELKAALKELLPSYMIPRTFTYHEALPSNANGKVDRKALQAQAQGR